VDSQDWVCRNVMMGCWVEGFIVDDRREVVLLRHRETATECIEWRLVVGKIVKQRTGPYLLGCWTTSTVARPKPNVWGQGRGQDQSFEAEKVLSSRPLWLRALITSDSYKPPRSLKLMAGDKKGVQTIKHLLQHNSKGLTSESQVTQINFRKACQL